MWQYEAAFGRHRIPVGQVLLTAQDISDRARYLNAKNTLLPLLTFDVMPIVNENDTVAVEEIKVGDNDNLSALVASLIDADLLVLLTDVDGLYTGRPARSTRGPASSIRWMPSPTRSRAWLTIARTACRWAAWRPSSRRRARPRRPGVPMVIASGREPGVLRRILDGESVGTYFAPKADRLGRANAGSHSRFRRRGDSRLTPGR